ncbi:unnamed protein product [Aphanomyces euteiches]
MDEMSPDLVAVLESLLVDTTTVHVALLRPLYDCLDAADGHGPALQLVASWMQECSAWIALATSDEDARRRRLAVLKLEQLLEAYLDDLIPDYPPAFYRGDSSFYEDAPQPNEYVVARSPPTNFRGTDEWNPSYDVLSPTHAFNPTFFARSLVSRSISEPSYVQNSFNGGDIDPVLFTAYAPPCVNPSMMFPFSIWAFLAHQRDEMHERATADSSSQHISRDILFPLRRGALAHVRLEVPTGFILEDNPTQALLWEGDVTGVDFHVRSTSTVQPGQVLFKATIIVGASVMVLRAFVFVAAARPFSHEEDMLAPLDAELEMLDITYDEVPFQDLELHEMVGRGHFGDAFRATYNGKSVVVKTVRGQDFGTSTEEIVKEFRHEAAVLNMFGHHPNIVPFVGASTDPSATLALITEFIPCGSLEDQLASHPRRWSVRGKTAILADSATGLLNVHEGGFVHRDIAARNVLVDGQDRAKLCDFGMCRRVQATETGINFESGVGPLQYMAPESLQPPHSFSYQSDAYSFGVLLWETFSERRPFDSWKPAEAAAFVLEGGRLDDVHIPTQFQPLLAKCFQENPMNRPSMATIVHTLADMLNN